MVFTTAEDVGFISIVVVVVGATAAATAGSELYVRGDPVAYLAPFGVIAGGSVGVGEGDC